MNAFQNKKVLIVGGSGFIGSHLLKRLAELGAQTFSLSKNKQRGEQGNAIYLQADLTDVNSLKKVLANHKFDFVFNLGGYINHLAYHKGGRQVIDAHLIGVLNLIDQVWWDGLQRFVQIGSSDEYGGEVSPQHEGLREAPISPYSFAKTASTHFIQMLSRTENFPGVVLRFFLVYGPGQDDKRFLPQIIKSCLVNQVFPTSEGQQRRDFCFIDDAVDAILLAAIKKEACGQVLNIASGIPLTIRNVLEQVISLIGKGDPQFGAISYRPGENMSLYADIAKTKSILGWESQTQFVDGLRKTIQYYAKNLEEVI